MAKNSFNSASLSVVIITLNEEKNITQALDSVKNWANEVLVLDSFSTDRTVELAKSYGCYVSQNKFENYSKQRNFALQNLPINTEWIFFLDADEWLSQELKDEINVKLLSSPPENGFYIKRRLMWMGKWIRRGYYPSWQLRLFRYGHGHCEDRAINEHLIVNGKIGYLTHYFTDESRKGVTDWISKHNHYSTREAIELLNSRSQSNHQEVDIYFFGSQAQRKRWLRYKIWNKLPPILRPFIYFFYRYVILVGFLDGRRAFLFHFLQALWYPLLIDIKYLEAITIDSDEQSGGI